MAENFLEHHISSLHPHIGIPVNSGAIDRPKLLCYAVNITNSPRFSVVSLF